MAKTSTAVEEKPKASKATRKRATSADSGKPAEKPAPAKQPSQGGSEQSGSGQSGSSQGGSGNEGSGSRPQRQNNRQGGNQNRQSSNYSQHGQQGQQGQQGGKRRKKKRKKGAGGGGGQSRSGGIGGMYASIPSHLLPRDEDVLNDAQELAKAFTDAKYKAAQKKALHMDVLQTMKLDELHKLAEKEGIEECNQIPRPELIYKMLNGRAEAGGLIYGEGTLVISNEGYGFLRSPQDSYLAGPDDIYVTPAQIREGALRTGMVLRGPIRAPKDQEKYFAILRVEAINGSEPGRSHKVNAFEDLTPLHPDERYVLETEPDIIETRIIDLVSPIGKGQRGLIVAPPRTGKTVLLQKMTRAIAKNNPEVKVIVLLIDERPE
jgi:transcription termination factor Rho